MDDEEPKGFQVRDRRRFTETGEAREEAADEPREQQPSPDFSKPDFSAEEEKGPERPPFQSEITLTTFLMSLSTQALMCLGDIPNPIDGKTESDLPAVRELIDVISMLQNKTRGNVDPAEARLFEKILFDLRMRFVEKARKQSP